MKNVAICLLLLTTVAGCAQDRAVSDPYHHDHWRGGAGYGGSSRNPMPAPPPTTPPPETP